MNLIHYSTVFRILDSYVDNYNSNHDKLSNHLRQPVVATAREIIKIYALSLLKANNVQPIEPDNVPCLVTNNVQLAKKARVSTRTIRRHIKRLLQANVLTEKIFRGSNASYQLRFNSNILLISGLESVENTEKSTKTQKNKTPDNQFFKKEIRTTCPHTDSSNNSYINNIIIGVDKKLKAEKQRSSPSLTSNNYSSNKSSNNFSGYVEEEGVKNFDEQLSQGKLGARNFYENKALNNSDKGVEEEGKSDEAIEQAEDMVSRFEASRFTSLKPYIESLWNLAKNRLYQNIFLTENQEKKAKELLLLWYEPVKNYQLNKVHNIYVERIELVRKYIAKDKENRYVQLPDRYFNPENKYGFTGTKVWYENQIKSKRKTQLKLILHAQIRKFINNEKKDTHRQEPRLQLFRKCEARIGKLKDQELLNQFYASILDKSTFNFLQLNT
ncbi:hypothetical protein [Kordia jejudonensis]|uniref:hypothetical protein n=1 Tax=Kordia jejudonensis TaxID=1348245 RepID=UPI000629A3D4|nr:hypothetical protein [Kordia jejudonensis]